MVGELESGGAGHASSSAALARGPSGLPIDGFIKHATERERSMRAKTFTAQQLGDVYGEPNRSHEPVCSRVRRCEVEASELAARPHT